MHIYMTQIQSVGTLEFCTEIKCTWKEDFQHSKFQFDLEAEDKKSHLEEVHR